MDIEQPRRGPSISQAVLRTTVMAWVGGTFGGFVLALSGVGGLSGGWVVTGLLGAAAGGVMGWFGWGRRGRGVAAATLALCGAVVGLAIAHSSVWSHGRMRSALGSITVPSGFVKVAERESGNSLCFDECSSVTRVWLAPGPPEQTETVIAESLQAKGYTVGQWAPGAGGTAEAVGRRGRLRATVILSTTTYDGAHLSRVPVPSDHTSVTVTLGQ